MTEAEIQPALAEIPVSAPTSTRWLLGSIELQDRPVVRSTYMVVSKATGAKGSAFALSSGVIVTNEHVIRGSSSSDLLLVSSTGELIDVDHLAFDEDRDLAALALKEAIEGIFRLREDQPRVGEQVHTWGYPLAYNGPSPLLSVGYLAGFNAHRRTPTSPEVKHYVVNGAFNPGNSGGPLIGDVDDAVIGVVVSKHAPIPKSHLEIIEALRNTQSGFTYTGTDEDGNPVSYTEGQLVGELLHYFREMTQVVIGEAIAAEELTDFLDTNGLAWDTA